MEPVYIIGAGAIGKVLAVCLSNDGKKVVLLRGSVDNGETHRENIRVTLPSQEIFEAEVTIDTLGNYRSLEGLVVLCNKSYGNAALADALKHKIGHSPLVLLQNGLGVEQAFMDFPAVYRCVLFVTSQPVSATKLNFKPVAISPIGRITGGDDTSLGRIASLLNTPYFGFRAESDIQRVIWKKAIVNSVFNSVCPLLDTDNGIFHRNPQALQIAESIVAECLCVAEQQGVNLNLAEVMGSLLLISSASDGQFISTLQDIRNHRPTEIATLNLAIAGMATTEQTVIQTRLLGQLTLLKSQLISAMFACLLFSCSIFHSKLPQKTAQLSPQTTQNLQVIKDLQPAEVWQHFVTLCSIPRCSGNEDSIASFIGQLATDHGFETFRYKSNDVLVRIPASPGFDNYPSECWQAHLDMVCQSKTGSPTAMYPVTLHREGQLIKANGTTLGADDGFGVAALMALITDRSIKHGPLELLFTANEESGFIGATAFDYALLKSRIIYNVDSEEEGIVTVGAAGIGLMEIKIPVRSSVVTNTNHVYVIKVSGLKGGHSGIDINKGRANAIKLIAQLLKAHPELNVVSISGGSAINTIPREAETIVATPLDKQSLQDALNGIETKIAARDTVEQIVFTLQDTTAGPMVRVLNSIDKDSVISFISKLPNGMLAMEHGSTTFVRTSNNVSIVDTRNDTVTVKCLFRSSSNKDIDSVKSIIEAEAVIANPKAIAKVVGRYAPWEPNFDSPLVKTVTDTYEQIFHKKMIVQTLHAALECAVFAQNIPDAQIVSIGPTVFGAHTPEEAVNMQSVADYWNLVLALLIKK